MMKTPILIIATLLFSVAQSQAPDFDWLLYNYGNSNNDLCEGVATNSEGNVIMVGHFKSLVYNAGGENMNASPYIQKKILLIFILLNMMMRVIFCGKKDLLGLTEKELWL